MNVLRIDCHRETTPIDPQDTLPTPLDKDPEPCDTNLLQRYLWFLYLNHQNCECHISVQRHIASFKQPLRWRKNVMSLPKLLQFLSDIEESGRPIKWRILSEMLGFDCKKATSFASRLKSYVVDNHLLEFLKFSPDDYQKFESIYPSPPTYLIESLQPSEISCDINPYLPQVESIVQTTPSSPVFR